jgi:hypothetical protein
MTAKAVGIANSTPMEPQLTATQSSSEVREKAGQQESVHLATAVQSETRTRMDPEVKAKWVAALRSGKYEQGQAVLQAPSGRMCCLGVLCDVLAPEKWEASDCDGFAVRHDGKEDLPADDIRRAAGFPLETMVQRLGNEFAIPAVVIKNKADVLHNHNDCGANFAEIADAIEAQL